jgi:hypothetical protein
MHTKLAARSSERAMKVVEDARNISCATLNERVSRSGDRRGDGRGKGAECERGESSNLHKGEHGERVNNEGSCL